jgi:hypothetical protein
MTLRTSLQLAIFGMSLQMLVVMSAMLAQVASMPNFLSLLLAFVTLLSNGGLLLFLITFLKTQRQQ